MAEAFPMKRWWQHVNAKRHGRSVVASGPRLYKWQPMFWAWFWSPGEFGLWINRDEDMEAWTITLALIVVRLRLSAWRLWTRREYHERYEEGPF